MNAVSTSFAGDSEQSHGRLKTLEIGLRRAGTCVIIGLDNIGLYLRYTTHLNINCQDCVAELLKASASLLTTTGAICSA